MSFPINKPPDLHAQALIELAVPTRTRQSGGSCAYLESMRRELNASHKIIAASVPSAPNASPISEPAVGTSRKSRSARIGSTTKIAPTDIAIMIQIFLRYVYPSAYPQTSRIPPTDISRNIGRSVVRCPPALPNCLEAINSAIIERASPKKIAPTAAIFNVELIA